MRRRSKGGLNHRGEGGEDANAKMGLESMMPAGHTADRQTYIHADGQTDKTQTHTYTHAHALPHIRHTTAHL